ncbi:10080_t:CDS:2 [Dentiscutata erythropus]|uniref:10080_t:CDS:1 n=1 Tax=Dentiscutata erythropus TaxID=1348616 RepID=A0A9N8Z730_9GLOM|nr:10080_t:CDS:2 [Dentiscutata erythropus]
MPRSHIDLTPLDRRPNLTLMNGEILVQADTREEIAEAVIDTIHKSTFPTILEVEVVKDLLETILQDIKIIIPLIIEEFIVPLNIEEIRIYTSYYTDNGTEIRDTTGRQLINVPTQIETYPQLSELNLPSYHANESKRVSPKPMGPIFKHVFRDEVVSILDQPTIKEKISSTLLFNDDELMLF